MTSPRRILHILPTLERAGAEKQVAYLAQGLPRDAFDVQVCALAPGDTRRGAAVRSHLADAGVPTTVLARRWSFDPLAFYRLEALLRQLRPDVVHAWLPAAAGFATLAARRVGVGRIIVGLRSIEPESSTLARAVDHYAAGACQTIVVNAPTVREACLADGVPANKLVLIPNAVAPLAASHWTRQALLAELNLPPGTHLIGAIGHLRTQKRLKEAMFAIDILRCIRDDVHLVVVGDGRQRNQLQRFARLSTLASHIHFVGARADVEHWLPHFDLVWHSTASEGLPNVVMEALAAGVPVVASDVPGNRDLVVHGENGFLTPLGDRAALARFANKLIDDPELRGRLGAAGRQQMHDRYSLSAMLARYAELYRQP